MGAIVITVRGEPQGKGRPRFVRATGRAYTPSRTVKYEDALRHEAKIVMGRAAPLTVAVNVSIKATFAIPKSYSRRDRDRAMTGSLRPTKKPDADNLMKVIDALNGVVWIDDKQVVDARVQKVYGPLPRMEIAVWPTFADQQAPLPIPTEARA